MERQLPRVSKAVTLWYDYRSKFEKFALLKMPNKIETSDIVRIFSDNLRTFRKAKNMSQSDLARAAGIGKAYISDIERQLRNPTIDSVERLAMALGREPWELLYNDDGSGDSKAQNVSIETQLLRNIHSRMFDNDTLSYGQFISDIAAYIAEKSRDIK